MNKFDIGSAVAPIIYLLIFGIGSGPSPFPQGKSDIVIVGNHFIEGAEQIVDEDALSAVFVSDAVVQATIVQRPASGKAVSVRVRNPRGAEPLSKPVKLDFA